LHPRGVVPHGMRAAVCDPPSSPIMLPPLLPAAPVPVPPADPFAPPAPVDIGVELPHAASMRVNNERT
jgi:hypothetical protein